MNAVTYYFEDIEFSKNILPKKNRIVSFAKNENKTIGSICFVFCSDNYLQKLNKKYLSHSNFTDVITFDYSEKNILNGDVIISSERIKENSVIYNVSFKEELYRVMIHGLLHLMGYKDKTKVEKKEMRRLENLYMRNLNLKR